MATRKHVLVMSYPAFGHYIPMLSVAERIIPHHDVTFVVSASKANDIRKRGLLPPAPIRFHTFDDELTINLDENFSQLRTLMDIMYDQAPRYARFIGSLNRAGSPLPHVDAVFCDIFNHAPCQPCRDNGIPLYIVSVLPAMLIAGGTRVTKDTPTVSDDTFFSSAAAGEEKDMTNPPMQESSKIINLDGIEAIKCCKAILFNSFEDLEPGAIQTLHDIPCMK
ncbi:uncharacterized protein LOC129602046, partial [Paramacrobiotus metropolitanus]|uniref:uncharacterized protein LOC129602046 n=1 Tax=Paramacrobiotus metropolitanus TaxID=2943436 RepID=UPI002445F7B6